MPLAVRGRLPLLYVALALALAFGVGLATAVGITITTGAAETGGAGSTHPGVWLSWWDQTDAIERINTPATPPTLISTTEGTPTVLPSASASYMINAGTAGHTALAWVINETPGISTNRELMLTFTVSTGGGPTITTIVAYVQMQGGSPATNWVYTFYWDSGSGSAISLNYMEEFSQRCSGGAGSC